MTLAPDLFGGVNTPVDAHNLTDLEKKHLPVIIAPDEVTAGEFFEVSVEAGSLLPHPNERGHFVHLIELFAGDVMLARLTPAAVVSRPVLKVSVRLSKATGLLRARAVCNLHGIWETTKMVTVV
ncbi:MAG: hypothetical protein IMZ66_08220 [Planctomycetes bacterium]|nr:hypothetical protein [Planctomycetota bacterium]